MIMPLRTSTYRRPSILPQVAFCCLIVFWTRTVTALLNAAIGGGSNESLSEWQLRQTVVDGPEDFMRTPNGDVTATVETRQRLVDLADDLLAVFFQTPWPADPQQQQFEAAAAAAGLIAAPAEAEDEWSVGPLLELATTVRDLVQTWDHPQLWAGPYPVLPANATAYVREQWEVQLFLLGRRIRLLFQDAGTISSMVGDYATFGYEILVFVMQFNRAAENLIGGSMPSTVI